MTTALPEPLGIPADLTVHASNGQVELHLALPRSHTEITLTPPEAYALSVWLETHTDPQARDAPTVALPEAVGITADYTADAVILWLADPPFTQPFVFPRAAGGHLAARLIACAATATQEATK